MSVDNAETTESTDRETAISIRTERREALRKRQRDGETCSEALLRLADGYDPAEDDAPQPGDAEGSWTTVSLTKSERNTLWYSRKPAESWGDLFQRLVDADDTEGDA